MPADEVEATRWLRDVLREDVVPLETVIARAKLEGIDLSVLWRVIRQSVLQRTGLQGARYLSWPRTAWRHPVSLAQPLPAPVDPAAVMRRLVESGDDRIVCQVCTYAHQSPCPGGYPIPGCIPNRCSFFRTTSESQSHEDI